MQAQDMEKQVFSVNPATEEVNAGVKINSDDEIAEILKACNNDFRKWKKRRVDERKSFALTVAEILDRNKRRYAEIITREMGKPIRQSLYEVEKCSWLCRVFAENAEAWLKNEEIKTEEYGKSYVVYEALGIVLGIMPWNFPFWQVFRFAIPALLAGNACILKHSNSTPLCSVEIERIFMQAARENNLPENIFRKIIAGHESAGKIIESELVGGVSLTGSVEAGKKIAEIAGKNIKKIVLELGGSDPMIILEDADIEKAAEIAVRSRMQNSGQSCIAAKRIIAIQSIADELKEQMIEKIKKLKVGNPMDESTEIGPLANRNQLEIAEAQIKDAAEKGANIEHGCRRIFDKGYFFEPGLISGVSDDARVLMEELFAPVACFIVASDEKEAISIANSTSFGLGASIFSENLEKAEELAGEIEAGMVYINTMVSSHPLLPFGGIKQSGIGRELGKHGILEFINIKTIAVKQ